MKFFITGHRGFIGTNLTKYLDEKGIEWEGFDLQEGFDIRDKSQLKIKMKNCGGSIVIHLAALAGVRDGEQRPSEYLHTNIVGTQNVIDVCKEFGIKHLISFSSSSVLGNQAPPNSETEPTVPISVYGKSKEVGEWLVSHSGINASIVRPFTVYGEKGRPNQVIMKWVNCIKNNEPIPFFGDGETKRGYTYVGDLINGVMSIAEKADRGEFEVSAKKCDTYHIGGAEVVSLNDLLNIFKEVCGEFEVDRKELPFGDVAQNWADLTKAKNELGYEPESSFKENVTRIIKGELNNEKVD